MAADHALQVIDPGAPDGEPRQRVHEVDPLVRQERLPLPTVLVVDPIDRHLHLEQRIGGRHAPIRSHHQPGPGAQQRSERVGPGRSLWPDERKGQLFELILERCPLRLRIGGDPKRPEPCAIVGVDQLEMRDVRPAIGRTVGSSGDLDGIEGVAHRALADGMEVCLEAQRIQLGHVCREVRGIEQSQTDVRGRSAVRIEVGLEQGARLVLQDAVDEELDAGRGIAGSGRALAPPDEFADLLRAARVVPTKGGDDPARSTRHDRPSVV